MLLNVLAVCFGLAGLYLFISAIMVVAVQEFPRRPVVDPPDWGRVQDVRIATAGGRQIEVWRIEPDGPSRGIVVLAHGWGRNRDRMVNRARMFGRWGYTTVIPSVRDHGGSDRQWFMNAFRFAEDIEAVLEWVGAPVFLYGHSAGSGGAVIAASRNPSRIRLLFLEGVYAWTRPALLSLYTWVNPAFGKLFGPTILWLLNWVYGGALDAFSPACLARRIQAPVMVIHGENDRRFPVAFAHELVAAFRPGQARLYTGPGAGHSDASATPGYRPAVKAFIETALEGSPARAQGGANG